MAINVDNIEETVSKNSFLGMILSIASGITAQVQETGGLLGQSRHFIVQLSADLGIIVGFLIGFLTLAVKIKGFYKEFFLDNRRRRR